MTSHFKVLRVMVYLVLSVTSLSSYADCVVNDRGKAVCDGTDDEYLPSTTQPSQGSQQSEWESGVDLNYRSPGSQPTQGQQQQLQNGADLVTQCREDSKSATNFCQDPLSASTGNSIQGGPAAAGIANSLLTIGGMYSAMSGGSSEAICNMMKVGGATGLGLNGGFATRCGALISDCESSCSEAAKIYPNDSEIKTNTRLCSANRHRLNELTQAAAQSGTATMMGSACQDATNTWAGIAPLAPPEMPAVGTDCSVDKSNPLCLNNGGGGGSTYSGSSSGAMDGKGTDDFNVSAFDDPSQGFNAGGNNASEGVKNSGVSNGGGGMPGGGSGSGSGGGGDEKGGRGSAGYKTDVLQGERAGGGYNVAQGPTSGGGGWSGYGGAEEKQKSPGLDLKQFLPGQEKAALRGPAGLNRANAELGPIHEDIFKKISARVTTVCKTNRLKDCK